MKRGMLGAAGVAALTFGVFASSQADDWPEFHGPQRANVSSETGLSRDWSGLTEAWSASVGEGFGGASVSGSEVFILDRKDDALDVLRCFDLESGAESWKAEFKMPGRLSYNGSRSTPTVTETQVFAFSPFGRLYCVDRKTHAPVWTVDAVKDFESRPPRWGFSASPLVVDGVVIVPPMGRKASLAGFDAKTGAVLWTVPSRDGESYESPVLRTLAGVKQVTWQVSDALMSVDPKTGRMLWEWRGYSNRAAIPEACSLGDDRLFLTAGYGAGSVLVKVSREGEGFKVTEEARIADEGAQIQPALYKDGFLYANFNRNRNLRRGAESVGLVCIDLEGKVRWQTGGDPAFDRGPVIMVDGLLVALGGEDGVLRLIDPSPEGYKELTRHAAFTGLKARNNQMWAPLAFAHGRLLARSQTSLKCFDLRKDARPAAPKPAAPKPAAPTPAPKGEGEPRKFYSE